MEEQMIMKRSKIVTALAAVLMAFAMIPVTALPVCAKDGQKALSHTEYVDISQLPASEQIESGATYLFMANITNSSSLSDPPKKRLLGASGEKPRINAYGTQSYFQVTESCEAPFSSIDPDNVIWGADSDYQFVVTKKEGTTDNGNQGYTIKNVRWGQYLNIKQDLQREIPTSAFGWSSLGYVQGTYHEISFDFTVYPTQPFVYLSDSECIWYWDSDNKEFYARYSTPSCDCFGDSWGFINTVGESYMENGALYHPHIAYSTCGEYAELVWLAKYVYNTHQNMGIYDQGFGADRDYAANWANLTESSLKVVLQGVNASNKQHSGYKWCAAMELHDPKFWAHYRVDDPNSAYQYSALNSSLYYPEETESTATLGVFNSNKMYEYKSAAANAVKYADFEKLTLYKKGSPKITFIDNYPSGSTRQESFLYNQEVDLSSISPSNTPAGAEFMGWSKTADGPVLTGTYRVTANETLYARWKYDVAVNPDDAAHGRVTIVEPSSFSGSGKFEDGHKFTAKAEANSGWLFSGWKVGESIVSTDPTHEFTCSGPMTVTAVFKSVKEQYGEHWTGEGTKDKPFVISDTDGWNDLCQLVSGTPEGSTKDLYFALGKDIGVSSMAGTSARPFSGTFDGAGYTLTFNAAAAADYCAPFSYVSSATFRNLCIAGTISTNKNNASGLAGCVSGTCVITNCVSDVDIEASAGNTHTGFVGNVTAGGHVDISGCAFTGTINGPNSLYSAGFIGWDGGILSEVKDCVYDGTMITGGNSSTFVRTSDVADNSYYTKPIGQGRDKGKQARSVTGAGGLAIGFGDGTEYSLSGITAYDTGLKYGGVFYAGANETIALTIADPSAEGRKYAASAGTLTGSGTAYQLVMPDDNVIISKKYDLQGKKVVLSGASFTYNGKVRKPTIKTIDGKSLAEGTDYTAVWSNASSEKVGKYSVTITGKGDYTGKTNASYSIVPATVKVPAGRTLTYNGKTQTGAAAGANYTVTGNKALNAGSYKAVFSLKDKANYTWTDGATGNKTVKWTISKAANPLMVKAKTAAVKYSAVKKKAQTLAVSKVIAFTKKGQGTMTYTKASGSAKITINKTTGKVTLKKGIKKDTYKVKIKVKAAGNANYKASAVKTVSVTIKVK